MEKNRNFEICSRAIIIQEGKILLPKPKNESWYFFPGGHIDFGEKAEDALKRELQEELAVEIEKFEFIGTVENYYGENGVRRHELDIIFTVDLGDQEIKDVEDHIEFYWIDLGKLGKADVFPTELKKAVLEWKENEKCF